MVRSLTLRELASPFLEIGAQPDELFEDVLNRAESELDIERAHRIRDRSRAALFFPNECLGSVVLLDDCLVDPESRLLAVEDESRVSSYARKVYPAFVVDGSACFLEGLSVLCRIAGADDPAVFPDRFLLVIENCRRYGVVTARHFFESPLVRAALWGMFLELEETIVDRARSDSGHTESCPESVRWDRAWKNLVRHRPELKNRAGPWSDRVPFVWLLATTMFDEKLTIARHRGWLPRLIGEQDSVQDTDLTALRNWCCHTGAEPEDLSLQKLEAVTRYTREWILQLNAR